MTTPENTTHDDGPLELQDDTTGAAVDANGAASDRSTDRDIAAGGAAGITLGALVIVLPMIPILDEWRTWIAGVSGLLDGVGIPLVVVSLLLPFLDDERTVRQLNWRNKVMNLTSDIATEVKTTALERPWVAALAAGYLLLVQLVPVIATALDEELTTGSPVAWAPLSGFVACMAALFVMQARRED